MSPNPDDSSLIIAAPVGVVSSDVPAMRADGAHIVHFPRTRLVAICSGSKRADRTNIDAHAAFFAFEMVVLVGRDDRTDATVLHAERPHVHAFAADAHTAIAQNAARPVEVHHRRPLLLFPVVLGLGEFGFRRAVGKRHVLQFALAAGIAHRAIQRMVAEHELEHRLARLTHLVAVRRNDHALGHGRGAGGLQLGHLLDLHDAHAARALQRESGVIAERGHFNAHALAGLDQQRARGGRDLLAVDCRFTSGIRILLR